MSRMPISTLCAKSMPSTNSRKPCTKQLFDLYEKHKCSVIAVEKVAKEMISNYGVIDSSVVRGGLHKIKDLVEKPKPQDAPSDLGIIGRYVLTPGIFAALKKTKRGAGGEIQLTDGLRLLNRVEDMYGWQFEGVRYDLGNKFEYMKASIEYGIVHPEVGPKLKDYLKRIDIRGIEGKFR